MDLLLFLPYLAFAFFAFIVGASLSLLLVLDGYITVKEGLYLTGALTLLTFGALVWLRRRLNRHGL